MVGGALLWALAFAGVDLFYLVPEALLPKETFFGFSDECSLAYFALILLNSLMYYQT